MNLPFRVRIHNTHDNDLLPRLHAPSDTAAERNSLWKPRYFLILPSKPRITRGHVTCLKMTRITLPATVSCLLCREKSDQGYSVSRSDVHLPYSYDKQKHQYEDNSQCVSVCIYIYIYPSYIYITVPAQRNINWEKRCIAKSKKQACGERHF